MKATARECVLAALVCALFLFVFSDAAGASRFVRGEINEDGVLDVSDPIELLRRLFLASASALRCRDAADVDDQGDVNIADAAFLLHLLFQGGLSPPPPFEDCGTDPTPDGSSRCTGISSSRQRIQRGAGRWPSRPRDPCRDSRSSSRTSSPRVKGRLSPCGSRKARVSSRAATVSASGPSSFPGASDCGGSRSARETVRVA